MSYYQRPFPEAMPGSASMVPMTAPQTPAPTTKKERVAALDFVRGLAVLGILVANIHAMGLPAMSSMLDGVPRYGFGNELSSALTLMLVNGKFRGMLAIMFGVGLAMQHERLSRVLQNWMGPYAKRTAFLLLIGFLHAVLIWFGDILFGYALTAFVAMLLVKLRLRWLAAIAGACWMITFAFVMVFFIAFAQLPEFGEGGAAGFGEPLTSFFSEENEVRIFQGGYLGQVGFRAAMFVFGLLNAPLLVIGTLPLFLIGVIAYRAGWVSPKSGQGPPLLLVLFLIVIGLALNALAFGVPTAAGPAMIDLGILSTEGMGAVIDFSLSIPLAAAYFFLFFTIGKKIARTLGYWATAVGRMALTAYLMQSVLGMVWFAGWGFGQFGLLNDTGMFYTMLGIWAIVITFCVVWMKFFDIGPVEKLWRQLSIGRRVPWRAAPPSAEPPPVVTTSGGAS